MKEEMTMELKVGTRVRFNTKEPQNAAAYTDDVLTIIADYGDDSFEVRYPSGLEQTVEAYDLEPAAVAQQPQLTIQSGKHYITRDGRKVGPMRRWSNKAKHRWEADDDDLPYIWADDGTEIDSDIDDGADLVAEASSSDNGSTAGSTGYGSTAGFTVPLCAYDDEPTDDDDIVQLSVGELTAALADSLKVARKVGKTIKRGDLVVLARPALVTGINVDMRTVSIQTDGGNYSLPLAALTAA